MSGSKWGNTGILGNSKTRPSTKLTVFGAARRKFTASVWLMLVTSMSLTCKNKSNRDLLVRFQVKQLALLRNHLLLFLLLTFDIKGQNNRCFIDNSCSSLYLPKETEHITELSQVKKQVYSPNVKILNNLKRYIILLFLFKKLECCNCIGQHLKVWRAT